MNWGYDLLQRIDQNPSFAAWIQAIGSIVALGIAIYAPWRQEKNRPNDRARARLLRARSMAWLSTQP